MFTEQPCTSKEAFLANVDGLIADLERLHGHYPRHALEAGFWHAESFFPSPLLPA